MVQHHVTQQVYRHKHDRCRLQEMQTCVLSTVPGAVVSRRFIGHAYTLVQRLLVWKRRIALSFSSLRYRSNAESAAINFAHFDHFR